MDFHHAAIDRRVRATAGAPRVAARRERDATVQLNAEIQDAGSSVASITPTTVRFRRRSRLRPASRFGMKLERYTALPVVQ
jgi:hypothetical protein